MSSTPTKAELQASADQAYAEFAATATKAELQSLLNFLSQTPEEVAQGTNINMICLIDKAYRHTLFDLNALTIISEGSQMTWQGGITFEGSGNCLIIDCHTFHFFSEANLEFDPKPDWYPVAISLAADPPWTPPPAPVEEPVPVEEPIP